MKFKRERDFLQLLCRDYILELIDKVGWSEVQNNIIKLRYLEHKSITRIRMDLYLTSATYVRYFDNAMQKLQTYLDCHQDDKFYKYY